MQSTQSLKKTQDLTSQRDVFIKSTQTETEITLVGLDRQLHRHCVHHLKRGITRTLLTSTVTTKCAWWPNYNVNGKDYGGIRKRLCAMHDTSRGKPTQLWAEFSSRLWLQA